MHRPGEAGPLLITRDRAQVERGLRCASTLPLPTPPLPLLLYCSYRRQWGSYLTSSLLLGGISPSQALAGDNSHLRILLSAIGPPDRALLTPLGVPLPPLASSLLQHQCQHQGFTSRYKAFIYIICGSITAQYQLRVFINTP